MKYIAQSAAFAALAICATVLEIYDKDVDGLWIVLVLWVLLGEWYDKKEKS